MKKQRAGIHPRAPYLVIRMTQPEAGDLMELLDGVDREGGRKCGMGESVRNYDRIALRLRMAEVRTPSRK